MRSRALEPVLAGRELADVSVDVALGLASCDG
jgi:hypothetical protein